MVKTGLEGWRTSAREGSRRLSGHWSHLKHKVYGTKPTSSEATTPPRRLWRQARAAQARGRRGPDTTLTGTWTFGGRRPGARGGVRAGQPAASAPASWLWSAGTGPCLPRSAASPPPSPSAGDRKKAKARSLVAPLSHTVPCKRMQGGNVPPLTGNRKENPHSVKFMFRQLTYSRTEQEEENTPIKRQPPGSSTTSAEPCQDQESWKQAGGLSREPHGAQGPGTRGPLSPLRAPSRPSPAQRGEAAEPAWQPVLNPDLHIGNFHRNFLKSQPWSLLWSGSFTLVFFCWIIQRKGICWTKNTAGGCPGRSSQPGRESSYQQLRDRQGLPLLAQGDVGEEGADGTVPLPSLIHKRVGIHKDFDFHGFIAREGHAPRNGDDAACGAERGRLSSSPRFCSEEGSKGSRVFYAESMY